MERQKSFDAVRCMREIRHALSREFQGMSFDEQRRYIRERVRMPTLEEPSGEYTAQPSVAGDGGPGMLSEHSQGAAHRSPAPDP